jgi:hypothetical protein
MSNPTLLQMPLAVNGDKNTIPVETGSNTGLFSQKYGFQSINSLPLSAGGKAISRHDYNGAMFLLSNILFYAQKGYTFEFDSTQDYFVGCEVIDPADGNKYRCIADVAAEGDSPSEDTTHWERIFNESAFFYRMPDVTYTVGDVKYAANLPSWGFLTCITGGVAGSGELVIPAGAKAGDTITDGQVVWLLDSLANMKKALAESTGYGIVSGCDPTISGLTVTIGAGTVHLADGTRKEIASTTVTLDAADSTNPRIDLVYIDSTGAVAKITGTAVADPSPAILSKNCIGLCIVEIPANSTTGVIKLKKSSSLVDSYTWTAQFRRTDIPATRNDATVYDGKMFYAPGDDGVLKVYDVTTNNEIANVTLSGGYKPHGNTICFGKKRNNTDTYPLLYITGYNGKDSNNNDLPLGTCFVYKINDDFTTEFVQQISIGFTADDLWSKSSLNMPTSIGAIGYGNFIVDTDRNKLIVFTDTNFTTRFFEFEIPDTSTSNVTLQQADIVENWDTPLLPWPQGTAIKDGKIYAGHGIEEASSFVSVIDLNTKSIISNIDVSHFTPEAEGVFFIDDKLFVNGTLKYHEVINYKKVDVIGALSSLQTPRNSSIVEAINSACYSGQALEAFTTGPAGRIKFLLITVYADENEDLKQPIKDAILNSQQYDEHTEIFFFHGLCSNHGGWGFNIITGFYLKTSTNLYFEFYPLTHREQAVQYAYEGTNFYKTNIDNANFTGEGRTNNLLMGPSRTRYIKLTEQYTTVLVNGNYGTKGILRQIVMGNNVAEITAYDSVPSYASVTVQALGNNTFSITTGDSLAVMLLFNKLVTVSNTI